MNIKAESAYGRLSVGSIDVRTDHRFAEYALNLSRNPHKIMATIRIKKTMLIATSTICKVFQTVLAFTQFNRGHFLILSFKDKDTLLVKGQKNQHVARNGLRLSTFSTKLMLDQTQGWSRLMDHKSPNETITSKLIMSRINLSLSRVGLPQITPLLTNTPP
jgi:hypothetical protein